VVLFLAVVHMLLMLWIKFEESQLRRNILKNFVHILLKCYVD